MSSRQRLLDIAATHIGIDIVRGEGWRVGRIRISDEHKSSPPPFCTQLLRRAQELKDTLRREQAHREHYQSNADRRDTNTYWDRRLTCG